MSSSANWQLNVRHKVYKEISKFPKRDCERIFVLIENLLINPYAGDIEKMKGETNTWRKRIGNYRVFYEIITKDKTIYVFNVERRASHTY